ncbi:uncharacterized protein PHALS_07469 [Plasmopara halstedii]|uniref:Uncharacterized protein n=1 Tax=Plasmopara halstedii TaxID=4781 RepID=A0A0P1B5D9_PLAHL|nr:uncharacterized protein PHALS_07469 [Plasmopara halstedii]CEG49717.1 hypothetical protein PHALS_07469 [Plasmopara halstedii]|eukprot:XP_024586086.1 hypothetical protein PHALS_07469 [Plasmopara halstedii]
MLHRMRRYNFHTAGGEVLTSPGVLVAIVNILSFFQDPEALIDFRTSCNYMRYAKCRV